MVAVDDRGASREFKDTVPKEQFDSRKFRPTERLVAFRQLTAPLFDPWPLGDPAHFEVVASGYQVGDMLFQQVRFSPIRFLRGVDRLRGHDEDILVLEAQLTGDQRLVMAHGPLRLLHGHIYLRDWGYPFDAFGSAMCLNSIVIPRHLLTHSNTLSLRNPVLSWPMAEPAGRLLSMLWAQLLAELDVVTLAEAQTLSQAFVGFLDVLVGSGASQRTPSTLGEIQQYINARLHGEVSIDDLCAHFHMSRSSVYRLFEPLGGIRQYITAARLDRCHAELLSADPSRVKVGEVASSWGFKEASSFTRSFRCRFGTPPSQVLRAAVSHQSDAPSMNGFSGAEVSRNYMNWLQLASGKRSKQG